MNRGENRMKKIIVWLLVFCGIVYAVVWFFFVIDGPIPTGNGLEKSDWLSFLASAIGGGITLILGGIVYWQNSRLESYANEANNISKKQLQLEKNLNRPYIRIYKDSFGIAVSKATYGFSNEYVDSINYDLFYRGTIPFEEQNLNCCYPPSVYVVFDIENTGSVNASGISVTRFLLLDGVTGKVGGFMSSIDTSTIFKQKQRVLVSITQQVNLDNVDETNFAECNKITNYYVNSFEKNIRISQLELRLAYKDVFGEEYFQEYSIHYSYDLLKETDTEYILDMKNVQIQHHIEKSPYGPRLIEE